MKTVSLKEPYSRISVSPEFTSVSGTSGLSLISPSQELHKVHSMSTNCLAASSTHIATARGSLIEVYEGQRLLYSLEKHSKPVKDLSWNTEGLLGSCSGDSKLFAWDSRQSVPAIEFSATRGVSINCLSWSRLSSNVLVSAHDTALKIWDTRLPFKSLATYKTAHPGKICLLDFHHIDANKLLTVGILNNLKLWKTSASKIQKLESVRTANPVIKALFAPAGNYIVYNLEHAEDTLWVLDTDSSTVKNWDVTCSGAIEDMDWAGDELLTLSVDSVVRYHEFVEQSFCGSKQEFSFKPSTEYEPSTFDREIQVVKDEPGVVIEQVGVSTRCCLVRVETEKHYLRCTVKFPVDYPYSPPELLLQESSIRNKLELRRLEKNIQKKLSSLARQSTVYLRDFFATLQEVLKKHSEGTTVNLVQELELEQVYVSGESLSVEGDEYSQSIPSASHLWTHSGHLIAFFTNKGIQLREDHEYDFFYGVKSIK